MIPTINPIKPKKGINLYVNGCVDMDWHILKQLLAGTIPISDCRKAA
jgi:hypothetical protein